MRPPARPLLGISRTARARVPTRRFAFEPDGTNKRSALPSHEEGRRSQLGKGFSHAMDNLQANIFIVGQRLNDLTGYSGIESLKRDIEEQETQLSSKRETLRRARDAYSAAISSRSASQREVNELLQRKHAWTASDLERFTALYRSDHENERVERSAGEAAAAAESEAEEASARLAASILARYHEEQIWSDKIRRMSTWGTWGLMGVNVLLFVVFQIAIEPWRRRRLVGGFEEKVREALEGKGGAAAAVGGGAAGKQVDMSPAEALPSQSSPETSFASSPPADPDAAADVPVSTPEHSLDTTTTTTTNTTLLLPAVTATISPSSPERQELRGILESWKSQCADLLSTRPVTLRKVDLTARILESMFAGAAIAGVIASVLRNR